MTQQGFPDGASGKEPACRAGDVRDMDSTPGLGRSPGGGHGNPLQYSCLENPMDRGAWWAMAHGVAKSQTGLKDLTHMPCRSVRNKSEANKQTPLHWEVS